MPLSTTSTRSAAEPPAHQRGVLVADDDDPRRLGEGLPLEALELPPLAGDVPLPQRSAFRLVVALPDLRLDVMGHQDLADAGEPAQGLEVGRPLGLPEVDGLRLGEGSDRPRISGPICVATEYGNGDARFAARRA